MPPVQIRTCGITAYGSCLEYWRQKLFDALVADRSTRNPGLVSGSWRSASSSSWPMHFPLPTPLEPTSLCSPASQVLLHRPTPRQRAQWDYGYYPCPRRPAYCRTLSRYPDSRAESVHTCQVLRLKPNPKAARVLSPPLMLPSPDGNLVGIRDGVISELNSPPAFSPVNASARPRGSSRHDSGSKWCASPSL